MTMNSDQTPPTAEPAVETDSSSEENAAKMKTSSESTKAKRKKKKGDIKRLIKAELKKEMKPLIVGSIAMLCSTVSNQGTYINYKTNCSL